MRYGLISAGLLVCALSLGVVVEPRLAYRPAYGRYDGSEVQIALGDAQRLFANQFYSKADVYMHRGFYPSIFDSKEEFERSHQEGAAPAPEPEGEPDFIERFSQAFYPSKHTHLGDAALCTDPEHHHEDDHAHEEGHEEDQEVEHAEGPDEAEIREILPWLKAAAELDSSREDTFVTGAYWLRTRLGKAEEAEEFLRDGLRANPGSYQILFELGRLFAESYGDDARARNVWEAALRRWREREAGKEEPDIFSYAQILWQLALVEERTGNIPRAIQYLRQVEEVSHNREGVEERIRELETRAAGEKTAGSDGSIPGADAAGNP